MTHCARILNALRDEQWHTTAHLYRTVGPCILHSRISDLRRKGHDVQGRHVPGKTGADGYEYRLTDSAPEASPHRRDPRPAGPAETAAVAAGGSREHVRLPVDHLSPRAAVPAAEQLSLHVAPPHYDL